MTEGGWLAIGPCWSCKQRMTFDPDRVPSIVVDGIRQPLCRRCVDHANALRRHTGMPPIVPLRGAWGDGDPTTQNDPGS